MVELLGLSHLLEQTGNFTNFHDSANKHVFCVTVRLGGRVCLIESHFMGGDCTNFGCVPSKALIKSAQVAKTCRRYSAQVSL